jgi:hypothetical protein
MWIRNQDRTELIDTRRISAENHKIYAYTDTVINDCNWTEIAIYGSKERALEVLDFIQLSIASGAKTLSMPKK